MEKDGKEKRKMRKRRLAAGILAILMFCGVFLVDDTKAYAWTSGEGEVCSASIGGRYTSSDGGYYYTPNYMPFLIYDENGNTSIGTTDQRHARRKLMMTDAGGETQQIYCVEAEVEYTAGTDCYVSTNGENSRYFQNLPFSVQYGIMCAALYGWQPGKALPIDGINEDDYSYATQMIIWEYQQQIRTSPYDLHDNGEISGTMYYESLAGRPAEKAYNWILKQMANHGSIPSFAGSNANNAPCHTLQYDSRTGRYSLTLTDDNNVLTGLKLDNSNGITVTRDGNRYTFSSDQMIENPVTITAQKDIVLYGTEMLIWGRPGYQTMMTGVADPLRFYLRFQTETFGSCKIVKSSEDGQVEGISFRITGNGIDQTVTTGSDGFVEIPELMPGIYEVTEQTAEKYEPQNMQRVTVVSGQISTVTFSNILKRGTVKVIKTSEDGMVEGVKFHLYGTSLSGLPVDEYAVTGSDGTAVFENILIGSGYTLEEVDTSIRYVVPEAQDVTVAWNEVTGKSFHNVLKKFRVTVTKSDRETGTAQGDASLAGAVYGLYKGETLVDTYTTDSNGSFITDYYVCADDWTIREISPSEGYLLDTEIHAVGAEPGLYTAAYNTMGMDVTEQVVKGSIALIKHTDDGETQIEMPEIGAVFQIYRTKAGTYENAEERERDTLTCDENGFAQSKELPYGQYTVHQVSGWEGRELMQDFQVYVAENGVVYRYLLNNANFASYIKVVKTDAETGNMIAYAGAGFQIYDPEGKLVTMTYTYPEVTEIDTFYTMEDGTLITPEKLPYGQGYSLVEVQAPYGYVLDQTPVFFDVVEEASDQETGITVVRVEKQDMPQKGRIRITKTGEVFASVMATDEMYQPIYEVKGLPGAEFEIRAAEDIITPDGTLRAAQGDIVDTLTTDMNGVAVSQELYLGNYEITEITAPEGMVKNPEIHAVKLTYAGQEIAVTETSSAYYNERQKVEITLKKHMEQDENFDIGGEDEIVSVAFGLYAAMELTAADGTAIPVDGLIEIVPIDEEGHGSCQTDLPFGSYYLKELATHEAYLPDETRYPVEFTYAGQDISLISLWVNGDHAIENQLKRGTIEGMKKDEDGNGLAGAVIGLFSSNCVDFTKEYAIASTVSAEDGSFSFTEIPYGNWIVREIESPEGFVLTEKEFPVTVEADGQIIEVEIENRQIRGTIILTKVDKDYPENRLTGAVFKVYQDKDENGVLSEADVWIGTMTEYDKGSYRMENVSYGSYLVKETVAPTGFYLDEQVYSVKITQDGQVVLVENEAGKGFLNEMQHGILQIKKKSEDGTVKGFRFQVTGSDILGNPFSAQYTTDEKGEIWITGLRIGSYTVSEISGDENQKYVLPKDQTVTITANTIHTLDFYNALRDIPDTGDHSHVGLYLCGTVICLSGGIGCVIQIMKKRRRK